MPEYLELIEITAAGSRDVGIPNDGGVLGIVSTSPITIEWVFNDKVGSLTASAVSEWVPPVPFFPMPSSSLRITAAAAADVYIRMCRNA